MPDSARPLHILHVAEAAGGGLMVVLKGVCLGHVEEGFAVTVVHGRRPETSESSLDDLRACGADVIEIPGWGSRTLRSELRAMRELRRMVREVNPDVVVLHSSYAGVSGLPLTLTHHNTVFAPHAFASRVPGGPPGHSQVFRAAELLACRAHRSTACVSASEARVARRRGARDTRVILNGSDALDAPDWPTMPEPPEVPTVAGSGRLVPQRRPFASADILSSVGGRARLQWLGGAGKGEYAERAADALTAAGVEVTGWVTNAEVRRSLRDATAYLHWTTWDGLPLTVLEAMAEDAVVVAAANEPNLEVVGPRAVFRTQHAAAAEVRRLVADRGYWTDRVLEQRERAQAFAESRMRREWNDMVREHAGRPVLERAPELAMAF